MMKETKTEKFVRLAEKRTTRALAELRKVGNLSAPNYEYTEEQPKAIYAALMHAVEDISLRFERPCSAENEGFSFVDWIHTDEDDDGIETVVHTDETG